jgi:HAD superfamily hydrolase (TIGR01490 family)
MKELVILDLDGTIIKGQSQLLFLNFLLKKRIIGLFFYIRIYLWFLFYKLGFLKNSEEVVDIMNYSFSFLKGKKREYVEGLVNDFFNKNIKEFIFSEMTDIINKHKSEGRELLIISNSVDVIVGKVAEFLGISNYIGTKLELVDGKFTGKILGGIVYGKNKIIFAKDFIEKNNLDFKNSWVYTDHISDLDLMALSSNPHAVNPDKLLKAETKKRNWPILMFKK